MRDNDCARRTSLGDFPTQMLHIAREKKDVNDRGELVIQSRALAKPGFVKVSADKLNVSFRYSSKQFAQKYECRIYLVSNRIQTKPPRCCNHNSTVPRA